jgi:hypothetical protein
MGLSYTCNVRRKRRETIEKEREREREKEIYIDRC